MPVLLPRKSQNQSSPGDPDESVFDFPDEPDQPSPSQVPVATAPRKNLSRTKRKTTKRTAPTNTIKTTTSSSSANSNAAEKNKKLVTSPLVDELLQQPSGSGMGTKKNNNITFCPMCRHQFPEGVDDETRTLHVSKCSGLVTTPNRKMMAGDVNNSSSETQPSCSKSNRNNESDMLESDDMCPVCNKSFVVGLSASDKEIHINKCLDNGSSSSTTTTTTVEVIGGNGLGIGSDEILARTLQHEEEKQATAGIPQCHFCGKSFVKLSVGQQTRHINTCMDKVELFEGKNKRNTPSRKAKTTKQAGAIKKRSTKIPRKTCPLCKLEHPENVILKYSLSFNLKF